MLINFNYFLGCKNFNRSNYLNNFETFSFYLYYTFHALSFVHFPELQSFASSFSSILQYK